MASFSPKSLTIHPNSASSLLFLPDGVKGVAEKYESAFPKVSLFTIDEVFGGWGKAQHTHFDEGGTFDQIQQANRR